MSGTTSNQKRPIVTKKPDHAAVHTSPDWNVVPDPPHPEPFANYVRSDELQNGTQTTFIAGEPVWTETGQLGPPSKWDHAGRLGGVISGTYLQEAVATSYSPDVCFENGHVVRVNDTTTQNHGNCPGVVLPDALALALAGLDRDCFAAAARTGTPLLEPGSAGAGE